MYIFTNKRFLKDYTQLSDQDENVKNFRLYYQGEETNLIWYDGRIFYIPKEYFELRNLINVNTHKRRKAILHTNELNLLGELKNQDINFLLEDNLKELFDRFQNSGLPISLIENVGLELLDNNDYTSLIEPIYLGNGTWLNKNC